VNRSSLRPALESGSVERLLVRAPNWLGDVAFAWPVFGALRRGLSHACVHVAARSPLAELIRATDAADAVLRWPDRGLLEAVACLRSGAYDAALLLTHSFGSALAPCLARVHHRLGYAAHGRRWLLSETLIRRSGTHQQQEYLALVAYLGLEVRPEDYRIRLSDQALAAGQALARELKLAEAYAMVAPGAAYGGAKQWGIERYGELAAGLAAQGLQVVVVGSASERAQAAAVVDAARRCGTPGPALVDLSGRTGLVELAALTAGARLLAGNDSGPLHLAAALDTPGLGIYGATDPQCTGPRVGRTVVLRHAVECSPCGRRECNQQAHHCMIRVTPSEALSGALKLLGGTRHV
jgi:heptosyltransferase-2